MGIAVIFVPATGKQYSLGIARAYFAKSFLHVAGVLLPFSLIRPARRVSLSFRDGREYLVISSV